MGPVRHATNRYLARSTRMVPSSVIQDFAYDPASHVLAIEFISGRRYTYHDVPDRVAEAMRKSISKGSFFNRKIRSHYKYTRIN